MRTLPSPAVILTAALPFLLSRPVAADETPRSPAVPIPVDGLRDHVRFLASDELAGRDSGEPGLEVAAEYIANRFREYGLEPAGDRGTYFQRFTIPFGADFGRVPGAVVAGPGGERKLQPGVDVVPFGYGEAAAGPIDAPLVFAGYGLTTGEEDRKQGLAYDDYTGLDVKGKAVILLRFVPRLGWENRPEAERKGTSPEKTFGGRRSPHATVLAKIRNARERGAAAVVFVTPPGISPPAESDIEGIAHRAAPRRPTLPSLVASTEAIGGILRDAGKDLDGLVREIDETLSPRSFEIPGAGIRLDTSPGHRVLRNVAATLPGRGDLAGEAVVIGAHYDHIGRFGNQVDARKNLGLVHNGADDNASGTAGVLELARAFSRETGRTGRSLIFLCFSGEEIGLLGSRAWLEARPGSAPPIAAMINLDMIGRLKEGGSVSVLGADSSRDFPPLLENLSKKLGIPAQWGGRGAFGGGSDHASFLNRSIPVLFFFTGMHAEYNTPEDDPPTLNYEGQRAILELVRSSVAAIAAAPSRPAFDAGALAAARTRGHGRPRLGVEIEGEDGGARVNRVIEDSPAARGGVKEGDLILGLGDVTVRSAEELVAAVEAASQGEDVALKVRRSGEDLTLKVLFPERRGGFRVVFGSVPDYGFAERGVRFESIRPGTPAEKAGVRPGDILLRWNGKEVEDVEEWTATLGGHKPGDEVTASVRRGGETVDLKVKLEARE
jgi:hypothetical protein